MSKKAAPKADAVTANDLVVSIQPYYLRELVDERIAEAVGTYAKGAIKEAVDLRVSQLVDEVAKDEVLKAVKEVLATGWRKTNEYGESQTCTLTLKDRIGTILNEKDRYSGSSMPWFHKMVQSTAEQVLTKDLKQDIEAAKASLKAQVDGALSMVIKKAMADQLGLKV